MEESTFTFKGGGEPYSSPELTVEHVRVEQGFGASDKFTVDRMQISDEEDW